MEDIAALETPIPLVVGDSWDWTVIFWDDPDKLNPYDLTGKTVSAQIRWASDSLDVAVSITDADLGTVLISLNGDDTTSIPLGNLSLLYVELIDGSSKQTWFRAPIEAKEGF